jgi:hypothetical protein
MVMWTWQDKNWLVGKYVLHFSNVDIQIIDRRNADKMSEIAFDLTW